MITLLYIDGYESDVPGDIPNMQSFFGGSSNVGGIYSMQNHQALQQISILEGITNILVHVNTSVVSRSQRRGLTWLQRFRREAFRIGRSDLAALPAVLCSFEDFDTLAKHYPLLQCEGHTFKRLPCSITEITAALEDVHPIADGALPDIICRFCLPPVWQHLTHEFSHQLVPCQEEQQAIAKELLDEWESWVALVAPNIMPAMNELRRKYTLLAKNPTKPSALDAVRKAQETLLSCLLGEFSDTPLAPAPSLYPPKGWQELLIVDDHGYVEATILELKNKGYRITQQRNPQDAIEMISNEAYRIILCDLHLPDRSEGMRVMRHALAHGKAVIAISSAALRPVELPAGVLNGCGPVHFQDAERLHQLIWQAATRHKVTEAADVPSQLQADTLHWKLLVFLRSVEQRQRAWYALPLAVNNALRDLQAYQPSAPSDLMLVVSSLVQLLGRYQRITAFQYAEILSLSDALAPLQAQVEAYTAIGKLNRLESILHNTVNQQLISLDHGWEELVRRYQREIDGPLSTVLTGKYATYVDRMRESVNACHPDCLVAVDTVDLLAQVTEEILSLLPPPHSAAVPIHSSAERAGTSFNFIVVEDNPIWNKTICDAIELIKLNVGPEYTISVDPLHCADDFRAKFQSYFPKEEQPGSLHVDAALPVVILDMGIPANDNASADREEGHRLLEWIREKQKFPIPVFVLTLPAKMYEDQLRAAKHGVEDFLFKDAEKIAEIVKALQEIVLREHGHRIEFFPSDTSAVTIDGIKVPLRPGLYQAFLAMCTFASTNLGEGLIDSTFSELLLNSASVDPSTEYALLLQEKKKQWSGLRWGGHTDRELITVIRSWEAYKQKEYRRISARASDQEGNDKAPETPNVTMWLEINNYQLESLKAPSVTCIVRDVLTEIVWQSHWDTQFEAVEALFGRPQSLYSKAKLVDVVKEIRAAIDQAFRKVGRHIDPKRVVMTGKDKSYYVVGQCQFHPEPSPIRNSAKVTRRRPRILVVENDEYYRQRVTEILNHLPLEVVVTTNMLDALREIEQGRLDLLSLDMHIPHDASEFAHSPMSGDTKHGEIVLHAMRLKNPSARVVIPTIRYQDDLLRERASQYGVHLDDFVPKGIEYDGVTWEGHFLSAIITHLRQLRYGHSAPLVKVPFLHIRILPETNAKEELLSFEANGYQVQTQNAEQFNIYFPLMRAAKRMPGSEVQIARIPLFHNKTENAIGCALNRILRFVATDWYGHLPYDEARDVAQRVFCIVKDSGSNNIRKALALHAIISDEGNYLNSR